MSLSFIACSSQLKKQTHNSTAMATLTTTTPQNLDTAVFAAGCFWCTEAVFLQIAGVQTVESGYMGGHTVSPTYESVCTGKTGHAEVCRIIFNEQQKAISTAIIKELNTAQVYPQPIVTSLESMSTFYKAEDYHQNYYSQNEDQPYCAFVIKPKVEKFRKIFSKKLKP